MKIYIFRHKAGAEATFQTVAPSLAVAVDEQFPNDSFPKSQWEVFESDTTFTVVSS